jgi:cytochrome c biogenesis protein CcdA
MSSQADSNLDDVNRSNLNGQFITGLLLGAVWSPCIGPTLGGAISLASQGQNIIWAGAIMTGFALGVSTIIIALGYGARAAIMRRQALMRRIAHVSRPIMGVVFILVGAAILFNFHHIIEAWAVQNLPAWLNDFSVSL